MPEHTAGVEDLIGGNLALVGHIARETAARLPRHLDTDDLVGAGALALVQAAHAFDASLGVPFARFASTRIRGAMIDQMRQRDWATRSVRSRARTLERVTEGLTAALQRTPTDEELAAAGGLSVAEVRAVREGTDRAILLSLDPLTADDSAGATALGDTVPRPDDVLVAAERIGYLRDAVAELPERVRRVVAGYYLEQRQLIELAGELGVTQSRASQLRAEGLDLLREALSRLLRDDARTGGDAGTDVESPDGVRARRRESYVVAVANRSTLRDRANVQAYLDGMSLVGAGPRTEAEAREGPPAGHPNGPSRAPQHRYDVADR